MPGSTRRLGVALLGFVLLFLQPCLLAQARDADETVLIRNVRLIDRDGDDEDAVVNILIKNGKLDVVTKDRLPASEATLVVDAQNGILLGKLALGEPPSFLIFDKDPREDAAIILDTKTHARFAVHEGEILKNTLDEVTEVEEKPPETRWLAYTPPPLALPTSYQNTKKWNRWDSKHIDGLFLAAIILDRQRWVAQDSASEQQVGDLAAFDGGEIRGLRFGAAGTLNFKRPWIYTIFAATNAFDNGFDSTTDDNILLFDYRLDIPIGSKTSISVGKQKEPISMERITSMIQLPMQERSSVSDALMPSRNFGVVMAGNRLGQRMTWAAGAFNDSFVTRDSYGNSSSQLVGRVTWLPFLSEDESNLVHLGFGTRYSNAREGAQAITEPEFNNAPPDFVDTGAFAADNLYLYDFEASWRRGPFWLAGEYVWTAVDSPAAGDPHFGGYHVTASWILSGEMRGYNKRAGIVDKFPVAKSVYEGGWGAWEAAVRWSTLDLNDGAIQGGELDTLSLGINWWLSPIFNVNVNYRHINLDRFGLDGASDGFNARVVLVLE